VQTGKARLPGPRAPPVEYPRSADPAIDPFVTTVYTNGGDRIVGAGVEYPAGTLSYDTGLSVDVTDTQVFIAFNQGTFGFAPAAFNGFQLTLLGGDPLFASLNGTLTTLAPLAWEVVGGNVLQVNMAGVDNPGGRPFVTVFDLRTTDSTTVIPVPGALLLALSGLGLLGFTARRSRTAD
jgi:hypothetical protein